MECFERAEGGYLMGKLNIGPEGASWNPDEGYRTCSVCGGDCEPEIASDADKGARFLWVCPQHGVHTITDPFEKYREADRQTRGEE